MVLSMYDSTCCQHGTGYQKCATALIDGLIGLNVTCLTLAYRLELYCTILTGIYAVKAVYASAVIYLMILGIYASGLALATALAAVNALTLIDLRAEH
jgi:hypothetical protein